jgi:hypothetical protein
LLRPGHWSPARRTAHLGGWEAIAGITDDLFTRAAAFVVEQGREAATLIAGEALAAGIVPAEIMRQSGS